MPRHNPLQSPATHHRPSWWSRWWRRLPPSRQDRFAALGPLLSVLLFLATIVAAISYFSLEERERERETVTRDVEYAQQRLRLRLLERQEQLMRMARSLAHSAHPDNDFMFQAESLLGQFPEVVAISWLGPRREIQSSHSATSAPEQLQREREQALNTPEATASFALARDMRQPIYSEPTRYGQDAEQDTYRLLLWVPLHDTDHFRGALMVEYSIDSLLRFGVPPEVMARYAVALVNRQRQVVAGSLQGTYRHSPQRLPWSAQPQAHEVAVSPVGDSLLLRAESYRTAQDKMGQAFFWLVGALSALTVWMLLGTWRHTRRRIEAQQALVAETNFRRAMENSMLTGMRTLDMDGHITYVNPAFCRMTGWSEEELMGQSAPFPYWPETDYDTLSQRLSNELREGPSPGGFEMTVQRKDGSRFYARMYISPLIAPDGQQAGWMSSITDITEPRRIREALSASYERFTTVLDSVDAAISVAPLGSTELLFASKMYRTWFGTGGEGHRSLVDLGSALPPHADTHDNHDQVDALVGLPTDSLLDASSGNAEILMPGLDKWLEVRTRYLTWVDGRLAQMVIATDITARRQAEEQAARQAERAQNASRLITMGEMASSVAHELNQPLTAISNYCSGMISRLQKQQMAEEDLLAALEKTARQAQRAGQIIQRIRAFVKRSEPNPTLSDVAQMVANATELADIELRRHMVRLHSYVAARLPALMVDPILIEQVLINLLKNGGEAIAQAQRPSQQRRMELRVGPKCIDHLPVVEFCVQDSGTGVPAEMLERIYEAFYSTKTNGMGIGLKLCRSIVESHHGRLQARNLYNGDEIVGCEFSFWIPVPVPAATAAAPTPAPSHPTCPPEGTQ